MDARPSGTVSGRELASYREFVVNISFEDVSVTLITSFHKDGKWVWITSWTHTDHGNVDGLLRCESGSCSWPFEDLENRTKESKLGLLFCQGL
jgi:hypothetical protein